MAIRKRNAAIIDYTVSNEVPWYQQAREEKPKLPLPECNILPGRNGVPVDDKELTHEHIRSAGYLFAGHEDDKTFFNPHDMLVALRTPRNKGDVGELRTRARIHNRGTAITAMCMDCRAGSRKQVTECETTQCPLWAFRFGSDPMRGKK